MQDAAVSSAVMFGHTSSRPFYLRTHTSLEQKLELFDLLLKSLSALTEQVLNEYGRLDYACLCRITEGQSRPGLQ